MTNERSNSAIEGATHRLRTLVLAREADSFMGSEEALQQELGVSRTTIRQVARLLEREGLLRVKRGVNGGYFAARPTAGTIEAIVSGYLATLNVEIEDLIAIAAVLWVEVVRKAATKPDDAMAAAMRRLRDDLAAMPADMSFPTVATIDGRIRETLFELSGGRYVELIFHINTTFARNCFVPPPGHGEYTPEHLDFVRAWRDSKMVELEAIANGDVELAIAVATHGRKLWNERVVPSLPATDARP